MKPKIYLLGAALAALNLGACSQEELQPEPANEGYSFAFSVAEDDRTRTTLATSDILRWMPTDRVGIYTVGANLNPNTLTVADVNQTPVEFIGILQRMVSPGDRFYAYYPYDAAQSSDPAAVALSIPVMQTQTKADVYNGETHPLVALPMEFPGVQDSYACRMNSVRFRQLGAIVELQLCASDEALRSETIRSVSFEADAPLAGDFAFDLTSVTAKEDLPIDGYESSVVTTALEEPAAIPAAGSQAARIYLTIAPGRYSGAIVVRTDIAQYTFRLAAALDFERAVIKGLPADLARAERILLPSDEPIEFADPETKRICVEHWDTNGDGELSYAEAEAVTTIDWQNSVTFHMQSFNELRYFINLKSIKEYAFMYSPLRSITIPDGVTVENQAFWLNTDLKVVTVGKNVTFGEVGAFPGCHALEALYGEYATDDNRCLIINGKLVAFAGAGLSEYTLPDSITDIGARVFANYTDLTNITIPGGVKQIGECTFWGCSGLTDIVIPRSVSSIGKYAFHDCTNLQSIRFLGIAAEIGIAVFSGCNSLAAFYVPNGAFGLASYNERYLTYRDKLVAVASCGLTECEIPYYVTAIGDYVFYGCDNLTNVVIPDKVTSIGDCAFLSCSNLTNVTIGNGVTSIGDAAFSGCSSLQSIVIPDGVTSIGDSTFSSCEKLSSIYCKPIIPPTLIPDDDPNLWYGTIFVPTASVETYKSAEGWSRYADRIVGYDFE